MTKVMSDEERKKRNLATLIWRKKYCTQVAMRINKNTEKKLNAFLNSFPIENYETKMGFIKSAVLEKAKRDRII